jgi:hypothetical protein
MSGKPGRSGRPRTDIGPRVLALYRKGMYPAAIGRKVGRARQQVASILKRAGISIREDAGAKRAKIAERVRVEWQKSPERSIVARRLGLTCRQVTYWLQQLRQQGTRLRPPQSTGGQASGETIRAGGCTHPARGATVA